MVEVVIVADADFAMTRGEKAWGAENCVCTFGHDDEGSS